MKETLVFRIKDVDLTDPIMVEGLPGVGHVESWWQITW